MGAPEGEIPPNKNPYFITRSIVIQSEVQLGTGAKRMAGEDVRDACRKERLGGTKSPGAKNLAHWQKSGA